MKLVKFRINNYRCVENSGEILVDQEVTCLVGKNESGKTALLQSLRRANPTDGVKFDVTKDYPRRHLTAYTKRHEEKPDVVVTAVFRLEDADREAVEAAICPGLLTSDEIKYKKNYKNDGTVDIPHDEKALVAHLRRNLPKATQKSIASSTTLGALAAALKAVAEDPEEPESTRTAAQSALTETQQAKEKGAWRLIWDVLSPRLPQFLYFSQYSIMRGEADLAVLTATTRDAATEHDEEGLATLLDLLELADVTPQMLQPGADYEDHKAKLEATANSITDDVFEYWSQNKELEVEFDVHQAGVEGNPARPKQVLHVRVKNRRHRVTVPFSERSQGFVWFFSFLAKFNRIAQEGRPLILLLDEPGVTLHASAQADFLRFIDDRLAGKHQVIYTTHSPFMIDASKLSRVRTVEDVDGKGTVVSSDVLVADPATAFPLQAALGYSLAQTLFLGPNCLLVEGPSDLIYFNLMGELLREKKREGLDQRWVLTPVAGAGKLAAFVTLLGANRLNVVVAMDFAKGDAQKVQNILNTGLVGPQAVVKLSDVLKRAEADVEDFFDEETYCALVRAAYPSVGKLGPGDLPPGSRLVERVGRLAKQRGIAFDHYAPAFAAQKHFAKHNPPPDVLDNFEALFSRLNPLLRT